ncbi:hypothetical protein GVI59_16070 [Acetobacter sicerae]|nr:hypothetical protein [Acetobacter sicerae]
MHDGELRILDTDLAVRLGFAQPRDIRKLIARHGGALLQMGTLPTEEMTVGKGQKVEAYYLNRKQAIFITAKSETATATDITIEIIERFDAYERGEVQPAIPQTYAAALLEAGRLAAEKDQIEAARAAAQARVEELEPKAEALARISFAEGEFGLQEVAKMIQVKPGKFMDFLDTHRWRFARGKVKLAYQDKIDAGYLRNKPYTYRDSNGEEHVGNTIRVTTKGLVKLAQVVPGASIASEVADLKEKVPANFRKAPEPAS